VQDLFVERVDPKDPGRYLVGGESKPFESRTEHITAGKQTIEITVRSTVHGPIIDDNWKGRGPLALMWTALSPEDTSMDALIGIDRAHDWASFNDALRRVVAPMVNFTYADRDGHIGYRGPGRLPVRKRGDGTEPLDGSDPANGWSGFVPYEQLPQVFDPPEGFIVSANQRVIPVGSEPYLARSFVPGYRAISIRARLSESKEFDLDATAKLHADVRSVLAERLRPLLTAWSPKTERQKVVLQRLRDWDCVLVRDSANALLYEVWRMRLMRAIFVDDVGEDLLRAVSPEALVRALAGAGTPWCDDRRTTQTTETCADVLASTLNDALAYLDQRYGAESTWRLDRAPAWRFRSRDFSSVPVLNRLYTREVRGWGDDTTVRVFGFDEQFRARLISTMIADFDLGTDETRASVDIGQSAHPLSPHYDDLLPFWLASAPPRIEPPDPRTQQLLQLTP
jgi:penicillin amidase